MCWLTVALLVFLAVQHRVMGVIVVMSGGRRDSQATPCVVPCECPKMNHSLTEQDGPGRVSPPPGNVRAEIALTRGGGFVFLCSAQTQAIAFLVFSYVHPTHVIPSDPAARLHTTIPLSDVHPHSCCLLIQQDCEHLELFGLPAGVGLP